MPTPEAPRWDPKPAQVGTCRGHGTVRVGERGCRPTGGEGVNYLPQLLDAIMVLLVGYLVAKILNKLITKGLQKARLDERLTANSGGRYVEKVSPGGGPARLVGGVVFWVIMLFVIFAAIATLNIPALTAFFGLVLSYLPRVLAALLIFVVAAAVAGAVGGLAHRTMGDTPTGRVVRAGAPTLAIPKGMGSGGPRD